LISFKSLLFLLLSFALLQALTFGPIFTHVGFYLDDWATLSFLHFAPKDHGYFGMVLHYLLNDSRVLIRPLEVLHYGTLYQFFGLNPLPYHISNLVFEAANSILFYCILIRFTGRRSLAYAGALLLLLYPSHDAAHYWAIASSLILSLVFYFASLLASMKATDLYLAGSKSGCGRFQALSFFFFVLSLFNYENFMPFLTVSALTSAALAWRRNGRIKGALLQGMITAAPLVVASAILVFYLKAIVPHIGKGYEHAAFLDANLMITVLGKGLGINSPPQAWQFFSSQAQAALAVITSTEIIRLIALLVVATGVMISLARQDKTLATTNEDINRKSSHSENTNNESVNSGSTTSESTANGSSNNDNTTSQNLNKEKSPEVKGPARLEPIDLLLLGLFTVFVSYTIFGVSHDYMPTYISMVNRINIASSVGVALVIVALVQWLERMAGARRTAYIAVLALATAVATGFYTLTTWGLSKPWIVSWTTQKEVFASVKQLKGKMDKDASLLLINCPRYVMWSPVFDGVWDFQNMVRIIFDQPEFNANVVSERLSLTDKGIRDVSYAFECGVYPFNKLFLMVAPHAEIIPIRTPAEFVDTVDRRGMTFGLDKKTLSKWREQAAHEPKLDSSH
jgi:hypothetical protein